MSTSSEQARKEYAEFEEKVKRTVFLDSRSPQVTSSVIETALGQFGSVVNLIKLGLDEEEKPAKQQEETLKAQYNKYGLNLAMDEDAQNLD